MARIVYFRARGRRARGRTGEGTSAGRDDRGRAVGRHVGGGTTFHFVTGGIHAALERANDAARGGDVRLGGGVATIREYLRERLIDQMHLAIAPVLPGSGEHLPAGIDLPKLGYECIEHVATPGATHVVVAKAR